MLYKYLFYGISYYVKKYDHLWDVGDTYFVGGSMFAGMTMAVTIINIIELIGIFWDHSLLTAHWPYTVGLPLVLGLAVCFYMGKGRRCDRIYKEIASLDEKKKSIYKIFNLVHVFLIWVTFFTLSDIIRNILRNN